jgi:hypothetical protein
MLQNLLRPQNVLRYRPLPYSDEAQICMLLIKKFYNIGPGLKTVVLVIMHFIQNNFPALKQGTLTEREGTVQLTSQFARKEIMLA